MSTPTPISPKMIDWILYNLPFLRAQVEALEPRTSTSVVVFSRQDTRNPVSGVERVAIKRAAISSVLDAAQRGIRALHPEQRKVYRMRYRAGMSYKDIGRRLYCVDKTVQRRIEEIRGIVAQFIATVPKDELKEFVRFFEQQ